MAHKKSKKKKTFSSKASLTTINSPELLTDIFLHALSLTKGACRVTLAGVCKNFQNVVQSRVLIHKSMVAIYGSLFSALQSLLTISENIRCKSSLVIVLDALASFVKYPDDLASIRCLTGRLETDKHYLERLLWTRTLSSTNEKYLKALQNSIWLWDFRAFLDRYGREAGGWWVKTEWAYRSCELTFRLQRPALGGDTLGTNNQIQ